MIMNPSRIVALPLLIALGALAGCSMPTPLPDASDEHRATLLYFHDAHEIGPVVEDGYDRGGVARLAAAIETVRSDNPETKVLFGGDLAGGTLFGGLYRGHPMVDALNTIGVDVANFGQHDFDFGIDNTHELVDESEFAWISSNLVDEDGEPFSGSTYEVVESGPLRIGLIGLTDDMDTSGADERVRQQDAISSAQAAVAELQESEDPDVIIAVTQQSQQNNEELVAAVPEIDAAFGEEMDEYEAVIGESDGRYLMAPEGNLGSLIRLDITRENGRVVVQQPSVIKVDQTVTPDPELLEVEDHFAAEMDQNLSTVLAPLDTPLTSPNQAARSKETTVGNFVADSFRAYHDTDIGWMNGGGIRADATEDTFTKRDAYAMVPFANKVIKIEATGAEIVEALEQGVADVADEGGGFPQVSGLSYRYQASAPVGSRVSKTRVGGELINPTQQYSVAITNYVVGGGDQVTAFEDSPVQVSEVEAPTDADAVIAYASSLDQIKITKEERIVEKD